MDYIALKAEIDTDPLAVGYSGFTDQQVADSLNVRDGTYTYQRPIMTGKEVKEAFTVSAEWAAIGAEGRSEILSMCNRDDLDPFGVDALIFQQAVGVNAPTAQSTLVAAREPNVSRAFNLGITSNINEDITAVDVDTARRGTV